MCFTTPVETGTNVTTGLHRAPHVMALKLQCLLAPTDGNAHVSLPMPSPQHHHH
eukprot:m.198329 g.198329  ORF g.198329 m.198329 type:complete len:54 (+) comp18741_c0_seq4:501-662(+)